MKSILIFIVPFMLLSCSSMHRAVGPPTTEVQTDSITARTWHYDSVYTDHQWRQHTLHDTVYIHEVQTTYRYRCLRDTVQVAHHDSIHQTVQVDTPRRTRQSPHSWLDKLSYACVGLLVGWILVRVRQWLKG